MWKFGDDVNTDLIIPGRYLSSYDAAHLAKHAMEGLSGAFARDVRPGDIIVAGMQFGCGSSREQAVIALKSAGVSAVVAKSFARIFYRNAVNLGLPVLVSADASETFEDAQSKTFPELSEDLDFEIPDFLLIVQIHLGLKIEIFKGLFIQGEAGFWDGLLLRGGLGFRF